MELDSRILVAEDDDLLAELIEFKLQEAGFSVERVSDGESALDSVQKRTPDALLLDIMLPGMDGFEVLRTLKTKSAHPDLPVMVLTGRGLEQDVVSGLDLGASDYLVKPFMVKELLTRIQRLLDKDKTAG
ncbi:Response regulator receiver domain-containing protein [Thiohalospira halophila DSM 15071]|uniref:Response regulator receiver domain-containing protein n=1 Tax=Thiohalospira halophila DSM 15071 TaxID=1123397 RepID=A0A1I1W0V9_9GAMM|nr:Response regulator receiver domain-containing protein [Thiohalospira halophila DSM 15071]